MLINLLRLRGTRATPGSPEMHGVVLIRLRRPLWANDEGITHDTNIQQFVRLQPKLAGHFGGNSHLRFFAQSGCGHGDPREVGKFYQIWNLRQQKQGRNARGATPLYGSNPRSAISAARMTARALFSVSCHSLSGTESATTPAPAAT